MLTHFHSGTPNSGTTSLSTLSTTAIKDGHQGHPPPHSHNHSLSTGSNSSTNTLEAERADRISRLAGLERVATIRQGPHGGPLHLNVGGAGSSYLQQPGYFDNANIMAKERSTVGSASATGSIGGRTTWASGSDIYDADKMSEDQDDGLSSAGLSDEGNASLVGFGEGAGSTVRRHISSSTSMDAGRASSGLGSPSTSRGAGYHPMEGGSPMQGVQVEKSRMTGQETSERIVRERLDEQYRREH